MASTLQFTPLDEITKIHARVKTTFVSGVTRPLAYRRQQLYQLGKMLQENEERLVQAINIDVGKPRLEATIADLGVVVYAVVRALENLEEWTAPEKADIKTLPEWRQGWDTTTYKTPKGAALLITPWNYPYIISLGPLVGAIAAGCTAVIKPSELCPTVSNALADLFPKYLDSNAYAIVNGAVEETTKLLELRWEHIFYTGSNRVGRVVAAAAAKHVTPLTLELGGKCPVVIAPDANIELSAKRILYGKQANLGQICVSPDYVLVPRHLQDEIVAAFKKVHSEFFPEGTLKSPDIGRIISSTHRQRLQNLLGSTDGEVVLGGGVAGDTKMEITIVKDVQIDDPLMADEIYGPILALVPVDDIDHAIRIIAERPTPLVIYIFSQDESIRDKFMDRTASGTIVLNDTYQQLAVHEMPFGGQGESGYGAYLGKTSFDTFTQLRGYIHVPLAADPYMKFRYPPYTDEAVAALSTFGMHLPLPKP
ncbi:hypothetical protein HETIRDRAFT_330758 [Heterobasidion irregulare TC 32-1]|uniref:Aldehyde dehydrogenase n=1 Tax=Heterobasidion irregulare (strain TC 32-1) TaxID=747525 RepID=W4JNR2_HETIT|nr:uncharacterized protein HETIRDRAFT_330758 [Heterobasidion irregulare TC 32-1]ETW75178.1 hypothetical protein HETIRDRAFT_330758 [Heterobasidion irregulare TC 32-1]